MKILFIFPNMYTPLPSWSPAIQILSSVLKEKGHETILIHIDKNDDRKEFKIRDIVNKVKAENPDLICATATAFEYEDAEKIAGEIKKIMPEKLLVLGGIHATLRPELVDNSNFDIFCVGEGEIPLTELVEKLSKDEDYKNIGSLQFKDKKNPVQQFVQNLDELPFFDWDLMDTQKLLDNRSGWLCIGFSRGCPYNCTFCINQALKRIKGSGKYVRRRSPELAIKELKYLVQKFSRIKVFNIEDDLFTLDKKWLKNFCGLYKKEIYKKYRIEYKVEARVDTVDEEVIRLLKESGCREIQFGVESGNEKIRNEIIKKGISEEQIIEAFRLCDKYKLKTLSFIMVGVPGETEESLKDTMNLLLKIQPYLIFPLFYSPIYGTPLYDTCVEKRLFRKHNLKDHFTDSPLKFENGLTNEKLFKFKLFLAWKINIELGHKNYLKLFKDYSEFSSDELKKKFKEILDKDEEIHNETRGLHYRYFNKNFHYLQRVD